MQSTDMKALKSFYTNQHLFHLNPTKPPSCLSFLATQTRQLHASSLRSRSEDSGAAADGESAGNASGVWSIYGPILGTERSVKQSDEETEKSSKSVKVGALGEGGGTQVGFSGNSSSSVESDGGSSKGKSYEGLKRNSLGGGEKLRMGLSNYSKESRDLTSDKSYVVGNNRKKGKSRVTWVCESCGYSDGQWWGYCRSCEKVGTMKQFHEGVEVSNGGKVSGTEVSENILRTWLLKQGGEVHPLRLSDVNRGVNQLEWRIALSGPFGAEVARVLGGGLVPGSLVLVGGDPGVGKSTLVLQIAAIIAEGMDLTEPASVVYVSGEESVEQIGNRADRMGITTEELFLYSGTDIEDILEKIQPLSPRAVIVDSIQTVYLKGVIGSAGGISQVKECTSAFLRFAKKTNTPVILIGHVNKSGDIAGPRVLEHIVDVVLYMEGEKYSSHRLLRSVKNRFGSTDELGVFEMSQVGLQPVSNPSEIFLSDSHSRSDVLAGLAVAVVMDGTRSFLIEVQALCVSGSSVARHVNGIQASRADMIISVLTKQAGLMLQQNAIFLNVVSGVTLTETAGDLAIAAAICSSFLEFPIPNNIAFIGEVGLGGELRTVPRMEKRVNTVAKLGYSKCIVPKSAEKSLLSLGFEGMKIVGCENLKDVINIVFKR